MKKQNLLVWGLITALIISILLMSGCISKEEPASKIMYRCPDGSIVDDLDKCPEESKQTTTTQIKDSTTATSTTTSTTTTSTSTSSTSTTTTTTTASPSKSPSDVVETYFGELMSAWGGDYEEIYDLISEDARPSDYEQWKDDLEIVKSALAQQGVYLTFIEVKNEDINGDTATVTLKYKLSQGLISVPLTRTIDLVKERDSWKLAKSYDFDYLT